MSKKPKYENCSFEKDGNCHALACFADINCKARDENGNPRYVSKALYIGKVKPPPKI